MKDSGVRRVAVGQLLHCCANHGADGSRSSRVPLHTPYAAQAVNLGSPSDQKEASAGKEEEPTEAYQQGRKVVATKRNDHPIETCKTWAKGKARPEGGSVQPIRNLI